MSPLWTSLTSWKSKENNDFQRWQRINTLSTMFYCYFRRPLNISAFCFLSTVFHLELKDAGIKKFLMSVLDKTFLLYGEFDGIFCLWGMVFAKWLGRRKDARFRVTMLPFQSLKFHSLVQQVRTSFLSSRLISSAVSRDANSCPLTLKQGHIGKSSWIL